MANKTRGYVIGLISLIVILIAAVALGTYTEPYGVPDDFVDNRSLTHTEGTFVKDDVVRYPAKVNASAFNFSDSKIKVGVASQTYELNFGNVPQNITVRKFVDLQNNEQNPVKLCFVSRGKIAPYINFTQGSSLILESGQATQIEILFNSDKLGIMDGEIDIVVRKPKYDYNGYLIGFVRC